jgi:hypothetical protein
VTITAFFVDLVQRLPKLIALFIVLPSVSVSHWVVLAALESKFHPVRPCFCPNPPSLPWTRYQALAFNPYTFADELPFHFTTSDITMGFLVKISSLFTLQIDVHHKISQYLYQNLTEFDSLTMLIIIYPYLNLQIYCRSERLCSRHRLSSWYLLHTWESAVHMSSSSSWIFVKFPRT